MKNVIGIFAPTEKDLQGFCPYCGTEVMDCFNQKYCGNCGKKIIWIIKICEVN